MSSKGREHLLGPGPQLAVNDVREMSLQRASGLACGLAFSPLSLQEGSGAGIAAGLGDGDPVQRRVHLAVAAAVQAVAAGALAGPAGDGRGAAEAGVGSVRAEAAHVSRLADEGGGGAKARAGQAGERVAVLGDQPLELALDPAKNRVQPLDLSGDLADHAGGGTSGQALAEPERAEPPERPGAGEVLRGRLGVGVELAPDRP